MWMHSWVPHWADPKEPQPEFRDLSYPYFKINQIVEKFDAMVAKKMNPRLLPLVVDQG